MEDQIHDDSQDDENALESIVHDEKDYIISQYGDGWSYKTFIDGEKIFLISNDLDNLKKKVKAKRLPLDQLGRYLEMQIERVHGAYGSGAVRNIKIKG